ncbi:MAG TPA: GGDEF domain-containing protein [Firmicutes bacterium]|nr:GGDEF domain-containing protein [Bacillota bacterium]HOQ25039.1 sensor domain-containing diguanylate cyclase [Bacillota bacterium]HPT68328.1 sensor domain-containing diguanylate cyclase [Bacillota bacterium]
MLNEAFFGLLAFLGFLTLKHQMNRILYRQLYEMESVFQQELAFVPLMKGIICMLLPRVKATAGALFWYDEIHKEMKIRTLKGIPAKQVHPAIRFLKKKEGLVEQVSAAGKSIYLKKDQSQPEDLPIAAWLGLPLMSRGELKGVLVLMRRKGGFSRRARQLTELFVGRCGIHMENALNHEMAVSSARENARLYLNLSRLYRQATRDELTGLYNRSFVLQRLREEAKKSWRYGYSLSLIFLDIDFFKKINDTFGHTVGDQVLSEVADIICEQVRDYDIPCRYGGEEFILVLPQTGPEGAKELAQRIRNALVARKLCQNRLEVTASFGVASLLPIKNGDGMENFNEEWFQSCLEELVARADAAMYVAKEKGRNRVEMAPLLDPAVIKSICSG